MGKSVSSDHRSRGAKSKKILASLLVLGVTGIAGVGATTSAFTDSATATTTVTAGTIDLSVNSQKSVTFNLGTNWKPGMTQSSTLTLKNSGTLPMTVNMATTTNGGTTGLANKLTTTITNTTGTPASLSPSGIMKNAAFSGLAIPAGGTVSVKIDAVWPSSGTDNNFAGKTDTVTYTFSATNS